MDEFKGQGAEMADGRAEEEGLEEVIYKQKRVAFLKVEETAEDWGPAEERIHIL